MIIHRLACVLALGSGALVAQDTAPLLPHAVRAVGEATVTATPDQARFSIGVSTAAPTAQAAAAQNATQTAQVLKTVRQALGSDGEVKTSGYSISPDLQFPKNGGTPKVTGYRANNFVMVTINNLSGIGKVIDAATEAGANNINGISFSLRNDAQIRAQALAEAAAKARLNAEAIAKALNLPVTGVLQAESIEASNIRPVTFNRAMGSVAQAVEVTPIEPSNIEIHASVVVTLAVRDSGAPR